MYPNPAREQVTLTVEKFATTAKVIVHDNLGRSLLTTSLEAGNTSLTLDVSSNSFSNGIYLVSIVLDEKVMTKRLVITK